MLRVVVLVLAVVVAGLPLPAPAQRGGDAEAAAGAAVALSRLEARSDFNALYDRIHPDAHAVIPRAAVVGWFRDEYAPLGPGVSTVTGVRFVEWTWPVTGRTYPYTAEVAFEQPFADGSVLEDVVRLVQDRNGEWRWFFGRSREFVEEQIARYITFNPAPVPAGGGDGFVEFVAADLDGFWREAFAVEPASYAAPAVQGFDQVVFTGCGPAELGVGPFYCGLDQTIYLDAAFMAGAGEQIGDFAAAFAIAHEWGHHVQRLQGFTRSEAPDGFGERYGIELELMADCYAGVWAQDADTRGILEPGDIEEAVVLAFYIGDAPGTSPYDPSAHGSIPQRVKAFLDGYFDGISACEELPP